MPGHISTTLPQHQPVRRGAIACLTVGAVLLFSAFFFVALVPSLPCHHHPHAGARVSAPSTPSINDTSRAVSSDPLACEPPLCLCRALFLTPAPAPVPPVLRLQLCKRVETWPSPLTRRQYPSRPSSPPMLQRFCRYVSSSRTHHHCRLHSLHTAPALKIYHPLTRVFPRLPMSSST